ncbi:hypothetical protein BDZ97DRAFT_1954953 [Flammula alnicola]|nr:hypothetical protein BDZ97DRAFT_1954953 [Flammula alnicola]
MSPDGDDDERPELIEVEDSDDEEDDEEDAEDEETAEQELERLQKDWRSPIYAFFNPEVTINDVEGRRVHDFTCNAKHCKGKGKNTRLVRRYLDTGDSKSTSSLHRHAKICWGEENVAKADEAKDVGIARAALKGAELRDGSITAIFERTGKGKVTYSHRPHTRVETRIVDDKGFNALMKTGRPGYYIPSRHTVARDTKHVFRKT